MTFSIVPTSTVSVSISRTTSVTATPSATQSSTVSETTSLSATETNLPVLTAAWVDPALNSNFTYHSVIVPVFRSRSTSSVFGDITVTAHNIAAVAGAGTASMTVPLGSPQNATCAIVALPATAPVVQCNFSALPTSLFAVGHNAANVTLTSFPDLTLELVMSVDAEAPARLLFPDAPTFVVVREALHRTAGAPSFCVELESPAGHRADGPDGPHTVSLALSPASCVFSNGTNATAATRMGRACFNTSVVIEEIGGAAACNVTATAVSASGGANVTAVLSLPHIPQCPPLATVSLPGLSGGALAPAVLNGALAATNATETVELIDARPDPRRDVGSLRCGIGASDTDTAASTAAACRINCTVSLQTERSGALSYMYTNKSGSTLPAVHRSIVPFVSGGAPATSSLYWGTARRVAPQRHFEYRDNASVVVDGLFVSMRDAGNRSLFNTTAASVGPWSTFAVVANGTVLVSGTFNDTRGTAAAEGAVPAFSLPTSTTASMALEVSNVTVTTMASIGLVRNTMCGNRSFIAVTAADCGFDNGTVCGGVPGNGAQRSCHCPRNVSGLAVSTTYAAVTGTALLNRTLLDGANCSIDNTTVPAPMAHCVPTEVIRHFNVTPAQGATSEPRRFSVLYSDGAMVTQPSALETSVVLGVVGCSVFVHPGTAGCVEGQNLTLEGIGLAGVHNVSLEPTDGALGTATCTDLVVFANGTRLNCTLSMSRTDSYAFRFALTFTAPEGSTTRRSAPLLYRSADPQAYIPKGCSLEDSTWCGHGTCVALTGLCRCHRTAAAGYWQDAVCDRCLDGFGGALCNVSCPISSVDNSTCGERSGHGACLNTTGSCSCTDGRGGVMCELACPTDDPAAVCSGHGQCNASTANCSCDSNFDGAACDRCVAGAVGPTCVACPTFGGAVCNSAGDCAASEGSARCLCNATYCGPSCALSGAACTACPQPGQYGTSCASLCPGSTADGTVTCGGHGTCDGGVYGSGACTCSTGFGGDGCGTACPGGLASPCSGHGTCDPRTAACTCTSEWGTASCAVQCPSNNSLLCGGHGRCDDGATSNATCSCDAGYTGATCSQRCPGQELVVLPDGAKVVRFCSGHGACGEGACTCDDGWVGTVCSECAVGLFGALCDKACPAVGGLLCSGHGTCGRALGCECSGHWGGTACDSCDDGFFGASCDAECSGGACDPCSGHGTCSSGPTGTGLCDCTFPFSGVACADCASGRYGRLCETACPASPGGVVCGGHGECSDGPAGNGRCSCSTGYAIDGDGLCLACDHHRYGPTCLLCPGLEATGTTTTGLPCGGHGQCDAGSQGKGACACTLGFVGVACQTQCPVSSSAVCGGHGACSATTGECQCTGEWAGSSCSTCRPDRYGTDCAAVCPSCGSHGRCDDGPDGSGGCTCSTGYYGEACVGVCPGGSDTPCSGHGLCSVTGVCVCTQNATHGWWRGSACSECEAPYIGSASCTVQCPSSDGRVCAGRGTCVEGVCLDCAPRADLGDSTPTVCGLACNITTGCTAACPDGFWGAACDRPCPTTGGKVCGGNGACRRSNGQCRCYDGFDGALCTAPCPASASGQPCSGRGACSGGACVCDAGFGDYRCGTACPATAAGLCSGHGLCSAIDGACRCIAGYAGAACDVRCPGSLTSPCHGHGTCTAAATCDCFADATHGFYDPTANCSRCLSPFAGPGCRAQCDTTGGVAIAGRCDCLPSFAGPTCGRACPRSLDVVCGGHGSCSDGAAGTGACTCSAGWFGAACAVECSAALCASNHGLLNSMCTVSGECQCLDDGVSRFTGPTCDSCALFKWGLLCRFDCPCNGNGGCDRRSGECQCFSGGGKGHWAGQHCDQCAPGYIGVSCQAPHAELSVNTASEGQATLPIAAGTPGFSFFDPAAGRAFLGNGGRDVAVFDAALRPFVHNATVQLPVGVTHTLAAMARGSSVAVLCRKSGSLSVELYARSGPMPPTHLGSEAVSAGRAMRTLAVAPTVVATATDSARSAVVTLTSDAAVEYTVTSATGQTTARSTAPGLRTAHHVSVHGGQSLIVVAGEDLSGRWRLLSTPAPLTGAAVWTARDFTNAVLPDCYRSPAGGTSTGASLPIDGLRYYAADVASTGATCRALLGCTAVNTTSVVCAAQQGGGHSTVVAAVFHLDAAPPRPALAANATVPSGTTLPPRAATVVLSTVGANGSAALSLSAAGADHTSRSAVFAVHASSSAASTLLRVAVVSATDGSSNTTAERLVLRSTHAMQSLTGDPERVVAIYINETTREALLHISRGAGAVVLQSLNLFAVESVYPSPVDAAGGTVVTVTGDGFAAFTDAWCRFDRHDASALVPATVVSSSTMTCTAAEATGACRALHFDLVFGGRTTATSAVQISRPATVRPLAAADSVGAGLPLVSARDPSELTIVGAGFVPSSFAVCRVTDRLGRVVLDTSAVRYINGTHVACTNAGTGEASLPPAFLTYSHDGTVFSPPSLPVAVVGSPQGFEVLHGPDAAAAPPALGTLSVWGSLGVTAAKRVALPRIAAYATDLYGNRLYALADHPVGTGPFAVSVAVADGAALAVPSDTTASVAHRRVTTAGVAVFDGLVLLAPKAGTVRLLFTASVRGGELRQLFAVAVSPGPPHHIGLANPAAHALWLVGVRAALTLRPPPEGRVEDEVGNTVMNASALPSDMTVTWPTIVTDAAGRSTEVTATATASRNAAGHYVFPLVAVRGVFGRQYQLRLSAADEIAALSTLPLPLEPCAPAEYGVEGSDRCLPCPAHASCDGSQLVAPLPGVWRSNPTSFTMYPCPSTGHYEGPVCEQCADGYGLTGNRCGECPHAALSWLLIATVGVVVCGIVSALLVTSLPNDDTSTSLEAVLLERRRERLARGVSSSTSSDDEEEEDEAEAVGVQEKMLPIVFKMLLTHMQMAGVLEETVTETAHVPDPLSDLFGAQQKGSSFMPSTAFLHCEVFTSLYRRFAIVAVAPLVLIALFAAITSVVAVVRGRRRRRELNLLALFDAPPVAQPEADRAAALVADQDDLRDAERFDLAAELRAQDESPPLAMEASGGDDFAFVDPFVRPTAVEEPIQASTLSEGEESHAPPNHDVGFDNVAGAAPARGHQRSPASPTKAAPAVVDGAPAAPWVLTPAQVSGVTAVIVLFLVQPTVMLECSRVLKCDTLDRGVLAPLSVVAADKRIACDGAEHTLYAFLAGAAMVLFGVVLPIASALLIAAVARWTCRGDLSRSRRLFFFMTGGYRRELWFWESVQLARKAVLLAVVTMVRREDIREYLVMWYFAVWFLATLLFSPYQQRRLTLLEAISQLCLYATASSGIVFGLGPLQDRPTAVTITGWVLFAVNVITLCVFAAFFVIAGAARLAATYRDDPSRFWFLKAAAHVARRTGDDGGLPISAVEANAMNLQRQKEEAAVRDQLAVMTALSLTVLDVPHEHARDEAVDLLRWYYAPSDATARSAVDGYDVAAGVVQRKLESGLGLDVADVALLHEGEMNAAATLFRLVRRDMDTMARRGRRLQSDDSDVDAAPPPPPPNPLEEMLAKLQNRRERQGRFSNVFSDVLRPPALHPEAIAEAEGDESPVSPSAQGAGTGRRGTIPVPSPTNLFPAAVPRIHLATTRQGTPPAATSSGNSSRS